MAPDTVESHNQFRENTRRQLDALKAEMESVARDSKGIELGSQEDVMKRKEMDLSARSTLLKQKFADKITELRTRFPGQAALLTATDALRARVDTILGRTEIGALKNELAKLALESELKDKNAPASPEKKLSELVEDVKNAIPENAPPLGAAKVEEDEGTEKTGWDKFGDTLQKGFAMFEKFYKQIMKQAQSYGATGLLSMAKMFRSIGWEKAALWLEDVATSDYAALKSARGNLKVTEPILNKDAEDPDAAAKEFSKQVEGFDAKLEELGGFYTASQGYPSKVAFFKLVVQKLTTDHPEKNPCTVDDLIAVAKDVPKVNPNAPKLAPQSAAVITEKPENLPTIDTLAAGADLMQVTKINFNGQALAVQVLPDGLAINGKKMYKLVPNLTEDQIVLLTDGLQAKPGTFSLVVDEVKRDPKGLAVKAKLKFEGGKGEFAKPDPEIIPLDEVKRLLTEAAAGNVSIVMKAMKFEKISVS